MISKCYLPGEFVGDVEYFLDEKQEERLPVDIDERKYVDNFCKVIRKIFGSFFTEGESSITGTSVNQDSFNQCVILTCISMIEGDGEVKKFSSEKDHLGREMSRLIVNFKPNTCKFIVDAYSNLDVRLVISQLKRFILTHIPRKWSSVNFNDIVPRILFRVKIWDTPRSYYRVTLYSCPMNVEYSYKIENARNLVGLPRRVDPKEVKCYERADLDIRRAIFGESTNVFKK